MNRSPLVGQPRRSSICNLQSAICNSSDRGVALLMTLLVLIIVTTLAAGMTFSGRTEVLVSRNYETAAVAMGAAEGGLNHAVEITSAYLAAWQTNPKNFANAGAAITDLLKGPDGLTGTPATDADNGSLENLGIPRPPAQTAMGTAFGASYEARVYDEDDLARGVVLLPPDLVNIGEPAGNPSSDENNMIVVQAIGYGPDNTSVRLEAMLKPISLPAIVTGGSLDIRDDVTVAGLEGSVHANGDLDLEDDVVIVQDATASGSFDNDGAAIGGQSGGGFAELTLPAISAINYRSNADYVLTSTGLITNLDGSVTYCDASTNPNVCEPVYGWRFPSGSGWRVQGNTVMGGTYYAETDVLVSGDPTATLTLIATGSITISGEPTLLPDTSGLLLVTDGDLRIQDEAVLGAVGSEGQILVHEQVRLDGDAQIFGQILAENAIDVSAVVPQSLQRISDATITYNGTFAGTNGFELSAWREVR